MDVVVRSLAIGRGRLAWHRLDVACTLGRGGVRADKREGDGATPIGRFPFRSFYWRPDRFTAPPSSRLPGEALSPDHGWCDAPDDVAYNRPVRLPYAASHERLWRDDRHYDVVVVLGHNDAPVVPFAGSAIFMHLMRDDGGATDGCIGLARDDLLALLAELGPGSMIEIA